METEEFSKEEFVSILKELRDLIKPPAPGARKTEGISKTALLLHSRLSEQREKCFAEFDRRLAALQKLLCLKITNLQEDVEELKQTISKWDRKLFAVKRDAEKTTHDKIDSFEATLNTIKNELLGDHPRGIKGIKDLAHDSKRWIELEEKRRAEAKEESKYSVKLIIAVITLVSMLGFNTIGTVIALIKLTSLSAGG